LKNHLTHQRTREEKERKRNRFIRWLAKSSRFFFLF